MLKAPIYLIPFDFSPVSDSALRLGLDLAEANEGSVYLLHIVKKASDKRAIRTDFDDVLSKLTEDEKKITTTKVIVGDLYEDMGKAGDLLKASLIVMGTHGAKGIQKVFGSHAIRMVSASSTPYLITQGKKTVDKIKTIVMPFSFAKESIQIATFAGAMAKKFNANIHLVGFHDKDEWLGGHTRTNQNVVRRLLEENEINHTIVNLPRNKSYEEELMDYLAEVDADIIAAAYFKEGVLPSLKKFIQDMIENEHQIPVLTVNTEELSVINSAYSFMTV